MGNAVFFFYLVLAWDSNLWGLWVVVVVILGLLVVVVVAAMSLLGYEEKCVGLFMVVLSLEKEREMEE